MEVLTLQVFVSLLLVVGSVVLLLYSMKHADHEHEPEVLDRSRALFPKASKTRSKWKRKSCKR